LWIKDFQAKSDGAVRNRLNINSLTDSFRILFQLDADSFGRAQMSMGIRGMEMGLVQMGVTRGKVWAGSYSSCLQGTYKRVA
jgi:hypothetical protein